jgi:hypothetical protein
VLPDSIFAWDQLGTLLGFDLASLGASKKDFIYLALRAELQVRLGDALGGESFAV